MQREERETVIVANLADLDEGYFTVETTEKGVLARLRRLAGSRLHVEGNRPWLCRVPAELWNGRALRIGRRRKVDGEALQNRLQAHRTPTGSRILEGNAVAPTPDMGREDSCAETLV
jgi:hypothetical protein